MGKQSNWRSYVENLLIQELPHRMLLRSQSISFFVAAAACSYLVVQDTCAICQLKLKAQLLEILLPLPVRHLAAALCVLD
jgi:hypothetical protein